MRLRRGLFGYRRSDVVAALEHLETQLAELASALERSWLERTALTERAEAAETALAEAVHGRDDAERELNRTIARLNDLLYLREQLLEELRAVAQSVGLVLERAESGHAQAVRDVPLETELLRVAAR